MDTSSAESIDHLRQRIDDEINSLQASIQALKSRRNELAPISRLPPETLAAIFSFLPSSRFAHVCSRWWETTLNYPRLWSYINFDMLTPVGMDEILTRAMTPLHLEANVTQMSNEQFDAFKRQLNAHISRYPPPPHLWSSPEYSRGTPFTSPRPGIPLLVAVRNARAYSALQCFQRHHSQPHKPRACGLQHQLAIASPQGSTNPQDRTCRAVPRGEA